MEFNIDDFLEKQSCRKIISKSKYEQANPASRVWWDNLFKDLEYKCSMPPYKKIHHLKKVYSQNTINQLESIGLEMHSNLGHIEAESHTVIDNSKVQKLEKKDLPSFERKPAETPIDPYTNFLNKSFSDAQIWRPQKKVSLDELSLTDKAQNITENIATEFDEWYNGMGSQRKSDINTEVILSLFQIVFDYPAATSLRVQMKELGSVSQCVADATQHPEFSESEMIRRQIRYDVTNMKKKPHKVAFGKTLPLSLRRKPFTENVEEKWLKCNVYHEDLASMAAIWNDITELQSTRSFCLWLLNNPQITPPSFLVKAGLMDEKILREPVFSACQLMQASEKSLNNMVASQSNIKRKISDIQQT